MPKPSPPSPPAPPSPHAKMGDIRGGDIRVQSFGCRLNHYEGELIKAQLHRMASRGKDVQNCVVINSCAVTSEAEKQVRQAIRRAAKTYPHHKIIVTGCAAHIDPEAYKSMAEVDAVVGNHVKTAAASYHPSLFSSPPTNSSLSASKKSWRTSTENYGTDISPPSHRVRAHLEIQNGCDHRCTFCVIPFGRGDSRSLSVEQVLRNIDVLANQGVREIILSGVDITSYGEGGEGGERGEGGGLGELLRRICVNFPSIRLRLSSVDGVELDDGFLQAFADHKQICPHVHLSLQSGNDLILKRMKRRHLRSDAVAIMERLRQARRDVVFGADFICGFPTETDAMFADTCVLVQQCGVTWLHVFPYSPRPGTVAARIPKQVPMEERKRRVRQLRDLGERQAHSYMKSLLGSRQDILLEHGGRGYTPGYALVRMGEEHISGNMEDKVGEIVPVRITDFQDNHLLAEPL